MSFVLALDQSTSATKALLFDAQGRVLDKASREHRQIYPQPGWVEHDPAEIWDNTLAVIREVAERNVERLSGVVCLSLSNQRETVVVFDRATGEPLHNAIVWQCRRGDALCRELREQGLDGWVQSRTGLKIDTYFSASKIAWLMRERPRIAAGVADGSTVFGTIDTFLIHRLTGGRVFATDCTNASRTLLFDVGRLAWDAELCGRFSVPVDALPEVRESASIFGTTDVAGLLPGPVPIAGVMGDSQASLFAQGCFGEGTAKATFGTGTSVLLNIGGEFKLPPEGAVTALARVSKGRPAYAFEGLVNYSAATLEWLKNQMGLFREISEVEALATAVPDNAGVYLVPAFAGLSAPRWAPDARAAILGLSAHSKREHVVRAALESIAYQLRDVLDMMRDGAGLSLRALHADGGPTRNSFLMQFTSDITGVDLMVSRVAESSPLGAAMNGLLVLGHFASEEELAAIPRRTAVFHPRMDADQAARLYAGWLAALARVL